MRSPRNKRGGKAEIEPYQQIIPAPREQPVEHGATGPNRPFWFNRSRCGRAGVTYRKRNPPVTVTFCAGPVNCDEPFETVCVDACFLN